MLRGRAIESTFDTGGSFTKAVVANRPVSELERGGMGPRGVGGGVGWERQKEEEKKKQARFELRG